MVNEVSLDQDCKHHVRNSIGGYRAERHKILKFLLEAEAARKVGDLIELVSHHKGIIDSIKRMDLHVLRIEDAVKKCDMVLKDECTLITDNQIDPS